MTDVTCTTVFAIRDFRFWKHSTASYLSYSVVVQHKHLRVPWGVVLLILFGGLSSLILFGMESPLDLFRPKRIVSASRFCTAELRSRNLREALSLFVSLSRDRILDVIREFRVGLATLKYLVTLKLTGTVFALSVDLFGTGRPISFIITQDTPSVYSKMMMQRFDRPRRSLSSLLTMNSLRNSIPKFRRNAGSSQQCSAQQFDAGKDVLYLVPLSGDDRKVQPDSGNESDEETVKRLYLAVFGVFHVLDIQFRFNDFRVEVSSEDRPVSSLRDVFAVDSLLIEQSERCSEESLLSLGSPSLSLPQGFSAKGLGTLLGQILFQLLHSRRIVWSRGSRTMSVDLSSLLPLLRALENDLFSALETVSVSVLARIMESRKSMGVSQFLSRFREGEDAIQIPRSNSQVVRNEDDFSIVFQNLRTELLEFVAGVSVRALISAAMHPWMSDNWKAVANRALEQKLQFTKMELYCFPDVDIFTSTQPHRSIATCLRQWQCVRMFRCRTCAPQKDGHSKKKGDLVCRECIDVCLRSKHHALELYVSSREVQASVLANSSPSSTNKNVDKVHHGLSCFRCGRVVDLLVMPRLGPDGERDGRSAQPPDAVTDEEEDTMEACMSFSNGRRGFRSRGLVVSMAENSTRETYIEVFADVKLPLTPAPFVQFEIFDEFLQRKVLKTERKLSFSSLPRHRAKSSIFGFQTSRASSPGSKHLPLHLPLFFTISRRATNARSLVGPVDHVLATAGFELSCTLLTVPAVLKSFQTVLPASSNAGLFATCGHLMGTSYPVCVCYPVGENYCVQTNFDEIRNHLASAFDG